MKVSPGRVVAALAVAVYVCFSAAIVTARRDVLLAHSLADDAFYYLKIASRFGEPLWPTFDGVHLTSGFHPLWLAVLVLLKPFVSDPEVFVRAAVALSSAFLLGAFLILGRTAARLGRAETGEAIVAFLAGTVGIARIGLLGMEASLALFLLAAFLHELHAGRRRPLVLGVVAGLAVLARLDTVLALGAACLVDVVRRRDSRTHLVMGSVAALVASPFFGWMLFATGHLSTVSAATKSLVTRMDASALYGGPWSLGYARWVGTALMHQGVAVAQTVAAGVVQAGGALLVGEYPSKEQLAARHATVALLAGGILVAGFVLSERAWRPRPGPLPGSCGALLLSLVLGAALHFTVVAVEIPGQADRWYWGVEAMGCAALLAWAATRGVLAARVLGTLAWAGPLSMVVLTVAVLHGNGIGVARHPAFLQTMAELANVVDRDVAKQDVVGSCNAGTLGYVSGHDIRNLDGVVNDWDFYEAKKAQQLRGWMDKENVRFVADCIPVERQAGYAHVLGLEPSDIDVVASVDGSECQGFLWKLHDHSSPSVLAATP